MTYTYPWMFESIPEEIQEASEIVPLPMLEVSYFREIVLSGADGGKSRAEYVCNLQGKPLEIHTGSDYLREGRPAQSYTYDARGNITGVQDGNGNRTEFLLDEWGRIVEIHTPEGGVERYAYDYAGNITSTTDANGGTITYRYNSQGQVSEIVEADVAR